MIQTKQNARQAVLHLFHAICEQSAYRDVLSACLSGWLRFFAANITAVVVVAGSAGRRGIINRHLAT
jgi:hypothetical protein